MILKGRRHDGKDVTERCSTTWSPVDGFFPVFHQFLFYYINKRLQNVLLFSYFPSVSFMINIFKGENITIYEACMIRSRELLS